MFHVIGLAFLVPDAFANIVTDRRMIVFFGATIVVSLVVKVVRTLPSAIHVHLLTVLRVHLLRMLMLLLLVGNMIMKQSALNARINIIILVDIARIYMSVLQKVRR